MRISDWSSDVCSSDLSGSRCMRRPGEARNWIDSRSCGGGAASEGGTVPWLPWACTAPAKLTAERNNHRPIRTVNANLINRNNRPRTHTPGGNGNPGTERKNVVVGKRG